MGLLSSFKTDDNIQDEVDSIGSGGALDSATYATKVTMAYVTKSARGATGVVLHLNTTEGREVRETLWVSSGDAKGNKNYYEDKNGKRKYLPGFTAFQSLCLLTVAKEVDQMDTENKMINVYSAEAGKEVPTEVPVLMDLLDQEIYAGIIKQTVDKNQKGDDGQYHPTGETRDENTIDKFFRASDKLTTAEIRGGAEEAVFFNTWSEKWTGVTRDRTSKDAPKAGVPSGGVAQAAAAKPTSKPTQSLFAASNG